MELCVALDRQSLKENLDLAKDLVGNKIWLKVGFRSFIQGGGKFIKDLKSQSEDFKIFLDLKLYDIPNTMADAAMEIAELEVDMFNVHASAGEKAMYGVMQRIENYKKRPLVLAVTALTSFDRESFAVIYNSELPHKAVEFAKMTHNAGLDGVVCSVYESKHIKEVTNNSFLTLTPGIRFSDSLKDDQKRVATPEIAVEKGVDFIVVGRPIYASSDPQQVTQDILKIIS